MLKTLELGVVGLPHRRPQLQYIMIPSLLYRVYSALQMMVCLRIKRSYHKTMSLSGREILLNQRLVRYDAQNMQQKWTNNNNLLQLHAG